VRRFCLSLALVLLVGLGNSYGEKAKATPTPEEKDKAEQTEKSDKGEEKKEDPADFEIPVPVGVPVKGIRIPQYNEEGKQIMLFDAEVAKKIDDENIEMENLKIEAVSDDDRKFYIELPKSVFNLQTRILNGTDRINIRRDDFELTGDNGEFHTKSRYAKITGDVKMIIFNTENLE
jgi:hypothetical protein